MTVRNSPGKEEHEYPSSSREVEEHSQNSFRSASLEDFNLTLVGIHIIWVKCWEKWQISVQNSFSPSGKMIYLQQKAWKTCPVSKYFSQNKLAFMSWFFRFRINWNYSFQFLSYSQKNIHSDFWSGMLGLVIWSGCQYLLIWYTSCICHRPPWVSSRF